MKTYTLRNYLSYLKDNSEGYWFKRRLFGWGWVPATKEGWLVIVISVVIAIIGVYVGEIDDAPGMMLFGILLAIAIILFFCFKKGEKPQWTWGKIVVKGRK